MIILAKTAKRRKDSPCGVFASQERTVTAMTTKQTRFLHEYVKDFNATQAAIRAGYSKKTAYSVGNKLLKNAEIKAGIDELVRKMNKSDIADATEVLEYLTAVMRGKSKATICVVEGTGEGNSRAAMIEKNPDEKERLKAAELLGKRYGLYTEKMDVTGAVPVVISGEDELED